MADPHHHTPSSSSSSSAPRTQPSRRTTIIEPKPAALGKAALPRTFTFPRSQDTLCMALTTIAHTIADNPACYHVTKYLPVAPFELPNFTDLAKAMTSTAARTEKPAAPKGALWTPAKAA